MGNLNFLLPALRAAGISIVVRDEPLRLADRDIRGEWDPLLRRIVLYDVANRGDLDLVRCFLHECIHALVPRELDETRVDAIADRELACMSAMDRAECAEIIRQALL